MAINPDEILADLDLWLPTTNVLVDSQLLTIINKQITAIGGDDQYYSEVFCKSLRLTAEINQAKSTGNSGLKSRKLEDLIEEEYYEDGANESWEEFISQLPTICAREGYTGLSVSALGFIDVHPGDVITVNDTSQTGSGYLTGDIYL